MRKLLNLMVLLTLSSLTLSNVTACDGFSPSVNPNPPLPNPPVTKSIAYYQNEIATLQKQIAQIQNDINDMNSQDMKQQICGSNTVCKELQQLIDSSTSELKQYQATVQDDNYQILVIQTTGNFSPTDKLQAIKYLQTELGLLTEKRTLMLNDPDYSQNDLQKLDQQVLLVNKELAKLISPKQGVKKYHDNDW